MGDLGEKAVAPQNAKPFAERQSALCATNPASHDMTSRYARLNVVVVAFVLMVLDLEFWD